MQEGHRSTFQGVEDQVDIAEPPADHGETCGIGGHRDGLRHSRGGHVAQERGRLRAPGSRAGGRLFSLHRRCPTTRRTDSITRPASERLRADDNGRLTVRSAIDFGDRKSSGSVGIPLPVVGVQVHDLEVPPGPNPLCAQAQHELLAT